MIHHPGPVGTACRRITKFTYYTGFACRTQVVQVNTLQGMILSLVPSIGINVHREHNISIIDLSTKPFYCSSRSSRFLSPAGTVNNNSTAVHLSYNADSSIISAGVRAYRNIMAAPLIHQVNGKGACL